MPPLASARIIDLKTARLTLVRNVDRVLPATLGAVPLTFRQWRGELKGRSPRLRWPAWIAAAAAHAVIGAAIVLYATMTTLPEPLPVIAVTLSFETPKPAAEPVAAPAIEAPPTLPEPAPSETLAPAPEPSPSLPPPEPEEAAAVETPPPMPVPEPEPAAAPEPPKPVATAPPSPIPTRRTVRPPAPATPRQAAPTQSATLHPSESPSATAVPAPSPPAPNLPATEQMAALPTVPPVPVSAAAGNRKPAYPAAAQRRHLEGRVVLRVNVSASGTAEAVAVAASSGHPALDQVALDAVRAWRFNPATRGGVAVAGTVDVPIQFRLEE
jgi:protein TonB